MPLLSGGKQRAGRLIRGLPAAGAVNLERLSRQLRRGAGPGDQAPHLTVGWPGAGGVQSMGDSSRDEHGRIGRLRARPAGVRTAVPVRQQREWPPRAPARPAPPAGPTETGRSSSGPMGVLAARITSPASSSSAIYMMETPVSALAVEHGPVDRGRTPVLGQQGRVDVDGAIAGGTSRMSSGRMRP